MVLLAAFLTCPLVLSLIDSMWSDIHLRILNSANMYDPPLALLFIACQWSDINIGIQNSVDGCLSGLSSCSLIHSK